ncbi:hypothetical protein NCS55_01374400 [Fusarium keratoplasticum]|nr:hypothetical protein NCS55_01374400 [Fusarium keratoplasticum]
MADHQETEKRIDFDPDIVGGDDGDSAIDSQRWVESTASITSSILEYRKIHGRTYKSSKTTEYWAPNDEKHVEGFDLGCDKIKDILTLSILKCKQRILDVGTGSGIWAIDMADIFPSAHIIGIDISPTQLSWIPPNLFDFIHIRSLHDAIDDWTKLYGQLFKFLKPGGWVQHMEPGIALRCDNPATKVDKDHVFKQWAQLFYDAGDRLGRTFDITDKKMETWACEAGFTQIPPKTLKLPYGGWPKDPTLKELGRYVNFYMDMSLGGFATYPMSQILGWSLEEITVLVTQMRAAINDQKNFPNGGMYVTYGQKPWP